MRWPETVVPLKPPMSSERPPCPGLSIERTAQPMPGQEDCSAQERVQPGYPWNCRTSGTGPLPGTLGIAYLA